MSEGKADEVLDKLEKLHVCLKNYCSAMPF
jgi:hypothetical protein